MVRVFRIPPWAGIFVLLLLGFLIAISLPLFLLAAGVALTVSLFRRSLPAPSANDSMRLIPNKKIGAYRIKADENDPNVIEVIDP